MIKCYSRNAFVLCFLLQGSAYPFSPAVKQVAVFNKRTKKTLRTRFNQHIYCIATLAIATPTPYLQECQEVLVRLVKAVTICTVRKLLGNVSTLSEYSKQSLRRLSHKLYFSDQASQLLFLCCSSMCGYYFRVAFKSQQTLMAAG